MGGAATEMAMPESRTLDKGLIFFKDTNILLSGDTVPRVKPTRQVVLSPTLVVLNKTGLQQLTNSKTQYGAVQCRSEVGSKVLRVLSHRPSCVSSPRQL